MANRLKILQGILPLTRKGALRDALSGVSLAAMDIPQLLGYARIAGMPAVAGLYTALLPLLAFVFFGASRHLVVAADSATATIFSSRLTGMASIGNIGSEGAADFTAMGEAVNIAFRLETATKEHGCDVLIAKEVFEALSDAYYIPGEMIQVELKGYDHAFTAKGLTFDQIGSIVDELLAVA